MLSLDFLRSEGVEESLIKDLEAYRGKFPVTEADKDRVPMPHFPFFGKEVWEDALSALLCGQNLLLVGPKATGKNVLAENLAQVFSRPMWNISFHINMDASAMLGTDTFKNGEVQFVPVRSMNALRGAASAFLTKSIWPATKPWQYFIPSSTTAAASTFRAIA